MRKYLACLAVTFLLCSIGTPAHADMRTRCRYQLMDGRSGWTVEEVKQTIRCLAPRFGISTEMALNVASHESGFHAVTGYDSHCGVYQHKRAYFPGRLDGAEQRWPTFRWMGQRCENARSNILAAFHLVKQSGGWEAGWCRWTAYC